MNGSPARKVSLRAWVDGLDVSAIAHGFGGGRERQAAGFERDPVDRGHHRAHRRQNVAGDDGARVRGGAASVLVRALGRDPRRQAPRAVSTRTTSSPRVRSRTRDADGAGAGEHRSPFATGLLVLLSGRATRLAPKFVGLDSGMSPSMRPAHSHRDRRPGRRRRRCGTIAPGPDERPLRSTTCAVTSSCASRRRRRSSRGRARVPPAPQEVSRSRCPCAGLGSTTLDLLAGAGTSAWSSVRSRCLVRRLPSEPSRTSSEAMPFTLRRLEVGPFSVAGRPDQDRRG